MAVAVTRRSNAERPSLRRTVPFDYAFRYDLLGRPENVINQIVTVSVEANFVAVSIGYGVIPKVAPIRFGPELPAQPPRAVAARQTRLRDLTIGQVFLGLEKKLQKTKRVLDSRLGAASVLTNGFKLNPEVAELVLAGVGDSRGQDAPLADSVLDNLFQVVGAPPAQIQFRYAIFDEGTGREFQSEPILSTAGLGSADGDRPFRYFAQPIRFAPKSTIRLQVIEVSNYPGELHVSLHGYKVLGGAGTPTGRKTQTVPAQ